MRFYTGIGSRKTPDAILRRMFDLAQVLESEGFVLRSGGADGADTAFEEAVTNPCMKHIYLPWKGFNWRNSPYHTYPPSISKRAFNIASHLHPAWNKLRGPAQRLMARNVYQILGHELDMPSEFLICWTGDGCQSHVDYSAATGGTGLAIAFASICNVPVFNLARKWSDEVILTFVRTHCKGTLDNEEEYKRKALAQAAKAEESICLQGLTKG